MQWKLLELGLSWWCSVAAKGYKGVYTPHPELPKWDVPTDAEYVADLVNVVVSVQQCSLLHGYAGPA